MRYRSNATNHDQQEQHETDLLHRQVLLLFSRTELRYFLYQKNCPPIRRAKNGLVRSLGLRVIGVEVQERVQELFSGWIPPASGRFHGDKYRVNLSEDGGVIESQHPAGLLLVIHIK